MTSALVASLVGLSLVLGANVARGQVSAMVPDAEEEAPAATPAASTVPRAVPAGPAPEKVSYGWQVLVSDVATGLTTAGLGATGNGNAALVNLAIGYAAIPPIIHLVHERPATGLIDLGVRVAAVGIGVGIGLGISSASCPSPLPANVDQEDDGGRGWCMAAGALVGAGIGVLVASVIDAAVLSWETPVAHAPAASPPRQAFTLSPSFVFTKTHSGLGVYGTF